MVDVRELYAQRIDAARQASSRGDRPAAAESLRSALDAARGEPGLQRELAATLVHLGKLEQELGRPADAERLLDEALEVGERLHGAEHPSLGLVLNELSRLHIRQRQHARAKTVLERLLRVTRTKGEGHPDVATALAGLGVVHRRLGDDAGAERHYRDALRIREKVLAPDHMATVVTLEQLSETCAARGNVTEALTLLQRALPTREVALGADHATVRAMRSRIDALTLRITSVSAPAEDLLIVPVRASIPTPVADMAIVVSPRESTRTLASLIAADAIVSHADVDPQHAAPDPVVHEVRQSPIALAPLTTDLDVRSPRMRTALFSSAGLAAAALAIAALASITSAGSGSDDLLAMLRAAQRDTATTSTMDGSTSLDLAGMGADAQPDSVHSVRTSLQLQASEDQVDARRPDADVPPAAPSYSAAPRRLAGVTVPVIATRNIDSLVRASTSLGRASGADQIGTTGGLPTSPIGGEVAARPPVLIGPAPLPYFPDALRSLRTEGEAVVRFRVDERGRVEVASMKVVRSDHELFTLAVRNALSRFRFEPARSAAPESKPRAEWVDFRAEFTARN